MQIVSESVERALRYIEILERGGAYPTVAQLNDFATTDGPRPAQYANPFVSVIGLSATIRGTKILDAEPVADYLRRMGWVSCVNQERLRLTELGRILLAGLSTDAADGREREGAGVHVITLEPTAGESQVAFAIAARDAGIRNARRFVFQSKHVGLAHRIDTDSAHIGLV